MIGNEDRQGVVVIGNDNIGVAIAIKVANGYATG